MKKTKFDFIMAGVTFAAAAVILSVLMFADSLMQEAHWAVRALMTGFIITLAALASLIAVNVIAKVRKSSQMKVPKLASASTAVVLVILFVAGVAGQILYSLNFDTVTETREEQTKETIIVSETQECEIVLMIDVSSSMSSIIGTVKTAATTFVDGLPDSAELALGTFEMEAKMICPLTKMDTSGKNTVNAKIKAISAFGGTDISEALSVSYNELDPQNNKDKTLAVVMITDGDDVIDSSVKNLYASGDVKLYSIRIDVGYDLSGIADIAKQSGGFDTQIDKNNNQIDLNALIAVFDKITQDNTQETTTVRTVDVDRVDLSHIDGSILYDSTNELTLLRMIIRSVFFAIFAILAQYLMFRKLTASSALIAIGSSLIASILVFAGSMLAAAAICIIGLDLSFFTVFGLIRTVPSGNDGSL